VVVDYFCGKIFLMTKFLGKYRADSHRLKGWNYAGAAIYFITIVTEHRACIFGEIKEGEMILSDFGQIVEDAFSKSFEIRKELLLHEFILMPNHLHALVEILPQNANELPNQPLPKDCDSENKMPNRKPKSISSFIAGFKAATVKLIDDFIDENKLNIPKYNRNNRLWQKNYHDSIVFEEMAYRKIKKYIQNNPKQWADDEFMGDA
jgi:putative transposase